MNWVGGARRRVQDQNRRNSFIPRGGGRGRGRGWGNQQRGIRFGPPQQFRGNQRGGGNNNNPHPQPPSSATTVSQAGADRPVRRPYSAYDVSSDPRYERVPNPQDRIRYRTVPLLDMVKDTFPNGDVLALHMSFVMGIDQVVEKDDDTVQEGSSNAFRYVPPHKRPRPPPSSVLSVSTADDSRVEEEQESEEEASDADSTVAAYSTGRGRASSSSSSEVSTSPPPTPIQCQPSSRLPPQSRLVEYDVTDSESQDSDVNLGAAGEGTRRDMNKKTASSRTRVMRPDESVDMFQDSGEEEDIDLNRSVASSQSVYFSSANPPPSPPFTSTPLFPRPTRQRPVSSSSSSLIPPTTPSNDEGHDEVSEYFRSDKGQDEEEKEESESEPKSSQTPKKKEEKDKPLPVSSQSRKIDISNNSIDMDIWNQEHTLDESRGSTHFMTPSSDERSKYFMDVEEDQDAADDADSEVVSLLRESESSHHSIVCNVGTTSPESAPEKEAPSTSGSSSSSALFIPRVPRPVSVPVDRKENRDPKVSKWKFFTQQRY